MTDYADFVEYVYSFYGTNGIYDMGANREQILSATKDHVAAAPYPFDGDSLDREAVRDIMIEKFGLRFPN